MNVGRGVGAGVSVGGRAVAVGIAIWVAATIVHAEDTAVPSTSAGAMVGVPCAPQAVNNTESASRMGKILFNIFSPFYCLFEYNLLQLRFYCDSILEDGHGQGL